MIWTIIPAVVLAVIIILGLKQWNESTSYADNEAIRIELFSKQFDWTARYAGNDKILGSIGGGIENNWDLSTKRATAIVNILAENKGINKQNLTAAGRGEFAPLMSNDSPEGKAKNRRIEIILTPKLDEISKMLNEL